MGTLTTIYLLVIYIGVPSWFLWVLLSPMWYGQKRWVLWYPPDKSLRTLGTFQAGWSVPLTYYTAKKYAARFNGTVYRVR